MMTPDRAQLECYLEQWLASKAPKCAAFMLAHVAGVSSAALDTVELTGKPPAASALADRLEQAAHGHLSALNLKRGRYTLAALNKSRAVLAQHFFSLSSDAGSLGLMAPQIGSAFDGELVDADGVAAPAAFIKTVTKHQAEMSRIYMGAFGALMTNMAEQVDRLMRRSSAIEQKHLDSIKLCEELMNRKHERDLEFEAQKLELKREDRNYNNLEKFIPIILGRMTGSTDVAELFRSLDKDKRTILFSALDAEQAKKLKRIFAQDDEAQKAIDELTKPQFAAAEAEAAE
jgi:hypothetical protein